MLFDVEHDLLSERTRTRARASPGLGPRAGISGARKARWASHGSTARRTTSGASSSWAFPRPPSPSSRACPVLPSTASWAPESSSRTLSVYFNTNLVGTLSKQTVLRLFLDAARRAGRIEGRRPKLLPQQRVVCGRGRNPTLSRCPPSVAVQALRFRRRGPSGPAHATGPAVRRTCRASSA